MRRAHSLLLGLATAALAGGAALDAQAQTAAAQIAAAPAGEARGLRYLSWSGRPAPSATQAVAADPTDIRRDLRRPNRVIPHGGSAAALAAPRTAPTMVPPPSAPAPVADRAAPTPANAWMRAAAPQPAVRTEPALPPPPPRQPVQPAARPLPDYLPDQGGRGQPVPADVALSAPSPEPVQPEYAPSDPMAPRRDAPIFRLRPTPAPVPQDAPAPAEPEARAEAAPPQPRRVALVQANPDDRPAPQGARRYSVHRQNGQTPDALTMPEPTYVDALAVTMTETPASQDLAQPDAGPTLIRDAQGRIRQQPAAPEGDYQ